jgi:hypothetical protein
MADDLSSRAERYRDIAQRLWRLSLERQGASFETRRSLGEIAEGFEDLAERVENETAAG